MAKKENSTPKISKTTKKTSKTTSKDIKNTPAKKTTKETKKVDIEKISLPKIKRILISQPEPVAGKSPYKDLSLKYGFKVDYWPFINVESLTVREFRKNKINIQDYTAVIFTSKNAIDFFFKICDDLRYKMPQQAKYFCSSEQIAFYLQKYIQYRKRKVSYGDGSNEDFENLLQKNKDTEKFILPCSAIGIGKLSEFLKKNKFDFSEAIMFKMVPNEELKGKKIEQDLITFFNAEGVKAFKELFPKFKKENRIIASFGHKTEETLIEKGLTPYIVAPQKEILSMVMAIEHLFKEHPELANK